MGDSWFCDKGYVKNTEKQTCDSIFVPVRARANSLGGFDCDMGYEERDGKCEKLREIEHGFYMENSSDF